MEYWSGGALEVNAPPVSSLTVPSPSRNVISPVPLMRAPW